MAARPPEPASTARTARSSARMARSISATPTTTASANSCAPPDVPPDNRGMVQPSCGCADVGRPVGRGGAACAIGRYRDAVMTPGSGTLTKCRSWVAYRSCATYHKIAVPEQIAIGDEISLTYGANTKTYVFHVVRIRQKGNSCAIGSERSGPSGEDEKLEIGQCRSAREPGAKAR